MYHVKCVMVNVIIETLEVTYKGKNIADVLEMTVEEATHFFENIPKLIESFKHLLMSA